MSVFAAVTATYIKHPAEKSLLSHVQFLRELLDSHVIELIFWVDTRDMVSDGLTKGAVDREALHKIMDGFHAYLHEKKTWQSKVSRKQADLIQGSTILHSLIQEFYPVSAFLLQYL